MAIAHGRAPDAALHQGAKAPSSTDMSMMRIAIAGTGGLALTIGRTINNMTSHQVVFLSRYQQPSITQADFQVAVVDYSNPQSLQFALRGVDTVISTVTGPGQIELIKAAVSARVRRFAPAEFESLPAHQSGQDGSDHSKAVARQWLANYSRQIQSTIFCCGILYERFQPGGLARANLGNSISINGEGDYIMDCRRMLAKVPAYNSQNQPIATITMTSLHDVGQFVTRSLDMQRWPAELRMCGQRMQVQELVTLVQGLKGQQFEPCVWHSPSTLRAELALAVAQGNVIQQARLRALINTAEGRYDFRAANLNEQFPNVTTITFERWFRVKWELD